MRNKHHINGLGSESVLGNSDGVPNIACATISVAEAAKITGFAESTIYQAIKEQRFPSLKIGNAIRVPVLALKRMLETGDMNIKGTEPQICVDEKSAQRVAEIVVMKLLSLEQQRLADQVRAIGTGYIDLK